MLQLSIFKRSSAFSGSPVNTGSLLFMMMMMCGIFLLLVTTRSVEAWTSTSSSSTTTIQFPHRLASFKMRQESAPFRLSQHRTSTCNMRRTDGRLFLSQSVPEDEEKLESSSGSELPKDTNTTVTSLTPKKKSFVARMKSYFQPADDGLTFRQRLSKMGLSVLLSYGWVSNMSYGVSVTCAWYISCKRVRTFSVRNVCAKVFFLFLTLVSYHQCYHRRASVPWLLVNGKAFWVSMLVSMSSTI